MSPHAALTFYDLDTDILTLAQKSHPVVLGHMNAHPVSQITTSILSIQEQLDGWHARVKRASKPHELARIYQHFTDSVRFLVGIPLLSFTEPAILRYEALRRQKLNIGKMDLRIAAIALENNAVLVTRNRRDFQRVPGFAIEDWSQ